MMNKGYQRRHLRAPFKDSILYADGPYVLKAISVNISAGGILIDQLPSFPSKDEVPLLFSVPELPKLRNYSLFKMQTYSQDPFARNIIRARVKVVRRVELSQNIDNIFRSKVGLEFIKISEDDQKIIETFISTFSSNLIFLQTLIDSYNSDEETKTKVRTLAKLLGYDENQKIALLRSNVTHDYDSLQWL